MALDYRKRLILEKIEATYGVSSTPAATDAQLCSDLRLMPLEGEYRGRDLVTGALGAQPELLVNLHAAIERRIEAAGSGAAGTAPPYADALMSCGFAETTVADTSVAYTLVSTGYSSTTIKTHIGGANGHAQTVLGCRGALSFQAQVNQIPSFGVRSIGAFAALVKEAPATGDFTDFQTPLTVEPANIATFTLGGATLCFTEFSFQDGRQPNANKYANCPGVDIGERAFTGRMRTRLPEIDAKNLVDEAKSGALQAMVWQIGSADGEIIRINAPKVQIKWGGYEDIDGDLGAAFDLVFTPDAGDDELSLTYL